MVVCVHVQVVSCRLAPSGLPVTQCREDTDAVGSHDRFVKVSPNM